MAKRGVRKARWFKVHAFANLLVCFTCLTSLFTVAVDPVDSMNCLKHSDRSLFGSASRWPLITINAVHVYHMIGGFNLGSADYFHHLLFIPLIGFPGQFYCYGALGNWQAFFISGLPGGLSYLFLALVKEGKMKKLTEKRYTANLNVWMRCPGILVVTVLGYCHLLHGRHLVPLPAILVQLLLPPYNALHYNKEATANYAVHYMLGLFKNEGAEFEKKICESSRGGFDDGLAFIAYRRGFELTPPPPPSPPP